MKFYYAKDLRAGNIFKFKGNYYIVIENSFNKTAMREGIVKCKVKNLRTGSITIEILTGEKLEKVVMEKIKANFLYNDQNNFYFMNNETYEEISINKNLLTEQIPFLTENVVVTVLKCDDEIFGISFPERLKVMIAKAEAAVQGNTVNAAMKDAWLSNNHKIRVPLFVNEGDEVLINSKTGEYISRADKNSDDDTKDWSSDNN